MAAVGGQNGWGGSPILRVAGESAAGSARDPAKLGHVGRRGGDDQQEAVGNGVWLGANHDVVDRVTATMVVRSGEGPCGGQPPDDRRRPTGDAHGEGGEAAAGPGHDPLIERVRSPIQPALRHAHGDPPVNPIRDYREHRRGAGCRGRNVAAAIAPAAAADHHDLAAGAGGGGERGLGWRSRPADAAGHPAREEDQEGGRASSSLPPRGAAPARLAAWCIRRAPLPGTPAGPIRGSSRHQRPETGPTSGPTIRSSPSYPSFES
jgi:hypothetical protein